ncbi:MAG: alanine racemase [Ponticaulis sp.]|nr:alanine racemase [Ponticaulis sp.]
MSDRAYFQTLASALDAAGIATPRLVIDRARLDQNIETLMASLPSDMGFRAVTKSLPSPELISRVMRKSKTDRLMTFNLPMLKYFSEHYPMADQLLGKPLPVKAMESFFSKVRPRNVLAHQNVQWLVDTPERLQQYLAVADRHGARIRINLEIDVGMHRGGFVPGDALNGVLDLLSNHERADLSGFMGYEPHVTLLPKEGGVQEAAREHANSVYRNVLQAAEARFGEETMKLLTRNAAGSPTYRLWTDTEVANELALGSVLVKPTNFDTELLSDFVPASFIAAPVLKTWKGVKRPGDPAVSEEGETGAEGLTSVFTYGGFWKADPVSPDGLRYHPEFGRSSNQDFLVGPSDLKIKPDDFIYLRPRQSEAVFLQFGGILVYENGQIVDEWPVLPASA